MQALEQSFNYAHFVFNTHKTGNINKILEE